MAYRLHPANEAPESVLNHDRPMGFHADMTDDESTRGISACHDLVSLVRWAMTYSATLDNAVVLLVDGEDRDGADLDEVICFPRTVEVIATGAELKLAMEIEGSRWVDADDNIEDIAEDLDVDLKTITPTVIALAKAIA